ncbi:MAG: AMP-binding protein [Treponema sp.]|jgi:long-chain acyl-CoA synthetase|nr:AMP-binding protein [Treponema sp.]
MNIEYDTIKSITDLKDMITRSRADYKDRTAFRIKTGSGSFREVTYEEYAGEVDRLGTALTGLGLQGKHIAILSENRYEWVVAYLSVINGVGVVVPISRDLNETELAYVLEAGDVGAVICSAGYAGTIKNLNLPAIAWIISFDSKEPDAKGILSYRTVLAQGQALLDGGNRLYLDAKIDPAALASILFTSGTTGLSKGVMLSHKNIAAVINGTACIVKFDERTVLLSTLPYHHAFECIRGLMSALNYGVIICINDSLKYFSKNLLLFKPESLFLAPAIIYGIHRRIKDAEKKKGAPLTREEARETFGGNIKKIFSGSAPLKVELIEEFERYGVALCQGYGLTETAPTVTTTRYTLLNARNKNTVGQVIPGCEVKIVAGEIWVKGDNVMLGYYKNPEATAAAFVEERVIGEAGALETARWFKTGDLGFMDDDGFLYINGRKKNVIIGSGGENVYPEEIERALSEISAIAEVLVYGGDRGEQNIVTAVIYPNMQGGELAGKSDAAIKEYLKQAVAKVNEGLPLYKQVVAIKIRKIPFEKTANNKIKRNEENTKEIS